MRVGYRKSSIFTNTYEFLTQLSQLASRYSTNHAMIVDQRSVYDA